ncbi:hypothetical protein [Paenibacillus alba]|uniref:Uncharacterized protein n=1 Tax=Paenibacillus alba TaxID=1197127 RepID=A0ABU6GF60_9BACL|nr:hypothetical protein [Paenibacillus alba]MEC0231309.1 hypothetical protein [Paenibacillus alba]
MNVLTRFMKGDTGSQGTGTIVTNNQQEVTKESGSQEQMEDSPYTFIAVYDFDKKLGIAGTNDLVQEILDAESYNLKTKHQNELEQKDQEIGAKQKHVAELEGTVNLLKLGEESHASEVAQLKASIERMQQEVLQANADKESSQQAHHELVMVHTKLQGDMGILQADNQRLSHQVEQLKQTAQPAHSTLEISTSAKLQEKASKVDEQLAAKKQVNWAAQSEIAMRRFQQDNGPLDQLDKDKPKETVTEEQLRSSFRSNDAGATMAQENTGGSGVQETAKSVDSATKDIPSLEQFNQLLNEVTNLQTWKADLESWKESEVSWRIELEKKLEGHGIMIRSQAG